MADSDRPAQPEQVDQGAKKKFAKKHKASKPMDKPTQSKGVDPKKKVASELPPPTKLAENKARQPSVKTTEESLQAESAFEPDSGFHAAVREISFTPSATGWTDTTDQVYAELRNDRNIQTTKELPIEALRYYSAAVFWLRAISLKLWQGQEITQQEQDVQRVFEGKTLALPEPIYLGVKSIGRTKTRNGEILAPVLPPLPHTVTAHTPGGLGVVSAENHNIYEDLPVMGPAYQGCYQRAQTINSQQYESAFAPRGTTANRNLQGFSRLQACRRDPLDLLTTMGFLEGERPRTISNTGINYNAVKTVSNLLTRTSIFKIIEVDIFSIPVTGSIAQIIEQKPTQDAATEQTVASSLDITSQAYSDESKSHIGISAVFGLNQWKSMGADNAATSWSSINYTEQVAIPAESIANRNARRNLPDRFDNRVFYTAIENTGDLRKTVISRLAKFKT